MQTFDRVYTQPSLLLSLDRAMQIDQNSMVKIQFEEDLYRQRVLAEKRVEPIPYRIISPGAARSRQQDSLGYFNEDMGTGKIV